MLSLNEKIVCDIYIVKLIILMKFNKSLYKKKYFLQSIKEVERDYSIDKVNFNENDNYFEIKDNDIAIKVADYYIYIYNEKN